MLTASIRRAHTIVVVSLFMIMLPSLQSFRNSVYKGYPTLSSRLHSTSESDILSSTNAWLNNFVLPLKLCPFAYRPLVTHRESEFTLKYLSPSLSLEQTLEGISREAASLSSLPEGSKSTTILVSPHPDFSSFLNYMSFVNDYVNNLQPLSDGLVQCAPFHPGFTFSGVPSTSSDNSVNRSPYPMFHLLLESDVSSAVEKWQERGEGGSTSDIWARNSDILQYLGPSRIDNVARDGPSPSLLEEIKRRF
jgi:hypothetical protein